MRYCTRANVHVDRCASAWLIRRFIDSEAAFLFVAEGESLPQGVIPFDMIGADWGHHTSPHGADCCTFETIASRHNLTAQNPALTHIARIIHGADIIADADETLESAGIDLLFRGLRLVCATDTETLDKGYLVMDALYAAVQAEQAPSSLRDEAKR